MISGCVVDGDGATTAYLISGTAHTLRSIIASLPVELCISNFLPVGWRPRERIGIGDWSKRL